MDHLSDRKGGSDSTRAVSQEVGKTFTEPTQTESRIPPPLQFKKINAGNEKYEPSHEKQVSQLSKKNGEGEHKVEDSQKPNNTGLPTQLKRGIENLSGFSLDDVQVHRNSDKPAQLQAHAYAQGSDIHLGPGQEKHLPHEAWHVVQQKQGRVQPTLQMKAFNINTDTGLEKEADEMGEKAGSIDLSSEKVQLKSVDLDKTIIQRRNWGKTIANIASLGIRKLVVNIMRANQQAPAAPVPVPPPAVALNPEDEFVNAYEKSRYYHSTIDADTKSSIENHGLLNYKDREEQLPKQVYGMSRIGGEFEGDEKKGVFLGPNRKWMTGEKMDRNVVRGFLPAERTVKNNTRDGTDVPSHELYRDGKFPGAFITKDSIGPDQVTGENLLDLLDHDDPKIDSILRTVATQYEGDAPDLDTLKQHMRSTIKNRRLSNAPLHDINDELMREDNL